MHKGPYFNLQNILCIIVSVFAAVSLSAQGNQTVVADFNPDSNMADLKSFNQTGSDFEAMLRKDECDMLVQNALLTFQSELHHLDSLLAAGMNNRLTELTAGHQFVMVKAPGATGKCISIMFSDKKTFPGCLNTAEFGKVDLTAFPQIKTALDEKKACLNVIKSNAFITQVEELPTDQYSAQTAENLLALIQRTLKTYTAILNYSFDQYKNFESQRAPKDLNGLIDFRSKFLSHCKNKLEKEKSPK